jgi:uncharacterized membrane protein
MQIAVLYAMAAALFFAIDIAWLMTVGASLYRSTLGDLLAPTIRIGPAVAFYLAYPVGIVAFAVAPAMRSGSISVAVTHGLLFGAIAYATYDLTNHATLRVWSTQITIIDISYGALATAAVASAVYLLARSISDGF